MKRLLCILLTIFLVSCSSLPIVDEDAHYQNSRINYLVIHFTSEHFARSMALLTGRAESRVSVHYVVPEPDDETYPHSTLQVYRLVPEDRRAWHAGQSFWNGMTLLNNSSIGIEVVNRSACNYIDDELEQPGPEDQRCTFLDFPDEQIDLVVRLAKDILERNPDIGPENVVGHADIATSRRVDPGPLFPWQRLYENGIGAWPDADAVARHQRLLEARPLALSDYQAALGAWGYDIQPTGEYDLATRYTIRAFQVHFRQDRYDGRVDAETGAILFSLLEKYRPDVYRNLVRPN